MPNFKTGYPYPLIAIMKNAEPTVIQHLIKDPVQLVRKYPSVPLTVDCAIFGFDENELKVLVIKSDLEQFKDKFSLLGDIVKSDEE